MLNVPTIAKPLFLGFCKRHGNGLFHHDHGLIAAAVDAGRNRRFLHNGDQAGVGAFRHARTDEFYNALIVAPELGIEKGLTDDGNFIISVAEVLQRFIGKLRQFVQCNFHMLSCADVKFNNV